MLPASRPPIGEQELEKVRKVFESGWLGYSSNVIEFENSVREFLGIHHAVAINTGTSALHLALASLHIGHGDKIIMPSLTFCSCVQVITVLGAMPVFCKVESQTLNVNIEGVIRRTTNKLLSITKNAEEISAAIAQVIENDSLYIGRPEVITFEKEFAAYIGTTYVFGIASRTEAITIALSACGISHSVRRSKQCLI